MTFRPLVSFLSLALLSGSARAACREHKPVIIGETQGYSDSLGSGECFVDIGPANTPTMIYRSYAFFDTGLLMVFNSFGPGDNSATTGSREFYFFPRSAPVDLAMDEKAGTISVTMANGDSVAIDPATGQIGSMGKGSPVIAPRVDPADRGGIEFPHYDGLMLDTGFARGHSAANNPAGEATFRSAQGQLCKVTNKELFVYAGGDHAFKFDDAGLSAWLQKRCPALHAGF